MSDDEKSHLMYPRGTCLRVHRGIQTLLDYKKIDWEFRGFLKKPLDESITLLVMAVHDSHMTINKDGGIGLDYVL